MQNRGSYECVTANYYTHAPITPAQHEELASGILSSQEAQKVQIVSLVRYSILNLSPPAKRFFSLFSVIEGVPPGLSITLISYSRCG